MVRIKTRLPIAERRAKIELYATIVQFILALAIAAGGVWVAILARS